jgi:ElaB/YqjD/DUF883 family membrane-anchored ribosome-binding protein
MSDTKMSDTNQRSLPGSATGPSSPLAPARLDESARSMDDPVSEVRKDLKTVRQEVESVAGAVKAEAESQLERAKDGTASFAGKQKDAAAQQLSGIAEALRKTSAGLESEQPTVAAYARSIAGRLERVSRRVESHDVDGLVGMAEDFGRRQPASMLGIAALAGFVSGRFLLASGKRRESRSAEATTSSAHLTNPSSGTPRQAAGARRRDTDG